MYAVHASDAGNATSKALNHSCRHMYSVHKHSIIYSPLQRDLCKLNSLAPHIIAVGTKETLKVWLREISQIGIEVLYICIANIESRT